MSFLRKGILAGFGSATCAVLMVVTNMLLCRALLPEGMGKYRLPVEAGNLLAVICCFGIGQANIFFLNRHKIEPRKVVMNSVWFMIATMILLMLTLVIILSVFKGYFGEFDLWIKLFFSVGISALLGTALLRPVLVADLQIRKSVQVQAVDFLVLLIIVAFCFMLKVLSVDIALAAVAAGHIVSLVLNLYFLRRLIDFTFGFDLNLFGQVLIYGFKLSISNIIVVTSASIAVLLLRYFIKDSFSEVGYFTRATAVCGLVSLGTASITPLLYAKWSGVSSTEYIVDQVERVLRLQMAIGTLIMIIVLLFGREIIIILYSRAFLPAAMPMYILVFGEVMLSVTSVHTNLLAGGGRPLLNALIFGISIPLNVLILSIVMPEAGIVGAAWAYTIARLSSLLLAMTITSRLYGIKWKSSLILNKSDIDYIKRSLFKRKSLEINKES